MGFSSIAVALSLAALATFALLLARSTFGRAKPPTRPLLGLLAMAALAAAIAHVGLVDRDRSSRAFRLREPPIHLHEYFHYFLGTKYFRELGHDRLYEATVIADREAEPGSFRPTNLFRDLRTNIVDRVRGDVIREGSLAQRAFSEARWTRFSADLALIRDGQASKHEWHRSSILRDHGYNGTPLTTTLLGTLANQRFVDTRTFFDNMRWMDLVILAGFVAWIGSAFGAVTALSFALLFFANPFNDYGFIGGCYLRYNFVVALGAAWVCLERGQRAGAGFWLAVSSHFRIFPLFFAVGLLLWDLAQPDRVRRLREDRRLFASFAATGLALVLATAWVQDPDGRSVWIAFTERLAVHTAAFSTNGVGLDTLFAYTPDNSDEAIAAAVERGEARNWEEWTEQRVARRAPYRWAALATLFAATVLCARRMPRRYALFLGLPIIFGAIYLAHYYYCWLGLLALVFRDDRRALLALTGFFGALAICAAPTTFADDATRYAAMTALLLAMMGTLGVLAARARPETASEAEPLIEPREPSGSPA